MAKQAPGRSRSAPKHTCEGDSDVPGCAHAETRVIHCADNLGVLRRLPDGCVDLIYIDPPFNTDRDYELSARHAEAAPAFADRHGSTQAYLDFMRPRCVELARVLKQTGCFYYHCDWHASHYVKVMLDGIFGEHSFLNEIVWVYESGGRAGPPSLNA